MVQTRHSFKEETPKDDRKDLSRRGNLRRDKQQPSSWDKENEKHVQGDCAHHLFNGELHSSGKSLRSAGAVKTRHTLRIRKEKRRYSNSPMTDEVSHENAQDPKASFRKPFKFREHPDLQPSTVDSDHRERRRSKRLRRELYESLNETTLTYDIRHGRDKSSKHDGDSDEEQEKSMYDYVKRHKRQQSVTPEKHSKRRRERVTDDTENSDDSEDEEEEELEEDLEEQEEGNEEEEDSQNAASYSLRKTKPITKRYTAPPISGTRKRRVSALYAIPHSPMHKTRHRKIPQHSSPHHRSRKRVFGERRKHYGSSTSSSSGDSDDERNFEKRKRKSMAIARARCLPINFTSNDVISVLKDRERARARGNVGSSLADVEPMSVDSKVTFDSIGGLDRHIRALKEMVVFPLLYPEVFEKFKISPPRGVLFHGPPGTGKTLVARALANECSLGGHKVAFFMRKGADCLSKWVGESERQLRLLFDQAYAMRPSIIFFDEIDGLAPVRSTRQDQIHSSIVSTLLALMDGLDARGEIVVIGATNRIDSIDPALRRPGRFDREFLFTLPNSQARRQIFEIHTKDWQPRLSKAFQTELADYSVGYCGADIKALCTEAALFALRRRYPQIYGSNAKLVIDVDNVKVSAKDFRNAMKTVTPASQRAVVSPGRSLDVNLKALLLSTLAKALDRIKRLFPPAVLKVIGGDDGLASTRCLSSASNTALEGEDYSSDDDVHTPSIYEPAGFGRSTRRIQRLSSPPPEPPEHGFLSILNRPHTHPIAHRPRFLLSGKEGMGQSTHLGPALLHAMEHLTVQVLDLPALFGVSARVPEEACAQIFREARRTAPCVIYLPHIGTWWNSISETTRATFVTLLDDLPPSSAILLLSTGDSSFDRLPRRVQDIFCTSTGEVCEVLPPTKTEREAYFKTLLLVHGLETPRPLSRKKKQRVLETLPVAQSPQMRQLHDTELAELRKQEENTLRELRLFLRQILWKLMADRKFKEFSKPVDLEEVPDYLDVIKNPMDLSTIMTRINSHYYQNCAQYLCDIDLITNNCLEYNPDRDQFDRLLRNRACELRDTAYAMVEADLDPEFEKMCNEIIRSRQDRGETRNFNAPSYVRCLQKNPNPLRSTPSATVGSQVHRVAYTEDPGSEKQVSNPSYRTPEKEPAVASKSSANRVAGVVAEEDEKGVRTSKRLKGISAPRLPYSQIPIETELRRSIQTPKVKGVAEIRTSTPNHHVSVVPTKVHFQDKVSDRMQPATDESHMETNQGETGDINEVLRDEMEAESVEPELAKPDPLPTELLDQDRVAEDVAKASPVCMEQSHASDWKADVHAATSPESRNREFSPPAATEAVAADEARPEDATTEEERKAIAGDADESERNVKGDDLDMQETETQILEDDNMPETGDVLATDDAKEKMEVSLRRLVDKTQGFSLTALEKIYSSISNLIHLHIRETDKHQLISEINSLVDRM